MSSISDLPSLPRSPSPDGFNNAQDTQISLNDLTTTTTLNKDKYNVSSSHLSEGAIKDSEDEEDPNTASLHLPSEEIPTTPTTNDFNWKGADPQDSPSPLLLNGDLEILENLENFVNLDSVAAVKKYKLHPSLLSDKPIRVILFNQDVGIEGIKDVTELLWVCRGPLILDLASNEIDDSTCEILCQGLHTPTSKVTVVLLSGNNIYGDGAAALGTVLARSKFLLELNLRLNMIGDIGSSALSNGLKRNRSLTKLNLSANSITADGALALADALAHNSSLKELDLSGNDLMDEGVISLVAALKSSKVSIVKLGCNGFGKRGATSLAELLPFPHLVGLYLQDNHIGDEGAIVIANSMHVNFSLKRLDVSGNQIGDHGAFAFAHALTMNKSFASFSIRNNSISPPGLLAVATALLNQPDLFIYNLSDNNVNPVEYRHIITMLEESWKAQHSNYFDDIDKGKLDFPSVHPYLSDPQLTHFLPPTDTNLTSRYSIPTNPNFSSSSSYSNPIFPPPSFTPTPSHRSAHILTITPQHHILNCVLNRELYDLTRNTKRAPPSPPFLQKKEVSFPALTRSPADDIEDRLKNAIDTMKQRVALRNDTFAQLQRARANSLPKRRRSQSQLFNSQGRAKEENEDQEREVAEEQEEMARREEESEKREERREEVVERVEVEDSRVEGLETVSSGEERVREIDEVEEDVEADLIATPEENIGLMSVGSFEAAKPVPATQKWIRDDKPFILKRHSVGSSSSLIEDARRSRPLYSPPPHDRSPSPSRTPPPTRAPPTASRTVSALDPPSLSQVPSMSSLASSSPPSPRSDDERMGRIDSSRRRKPGSYMNKKAEVSSHGPPLPQISNEDVTTIRHWFINLPPPFPVTIHREKKTSQATLSISREGLILAVKRKFGGTKSYKSKLSPDLKGDITMMFPGAFVLSSPDFKKPLTLSSPQRELILATMIVFIYGASTLLRNRAS